jgi:predicted DNA repair protein MutK
MPSGLIALLDDVAGIAKLAASSLDDVGAAAGKAGTKAAGVVIDDAAVTPRYVTGLTPDRELPIIAKIARGSLRNKLVFLLPLALLLSALAPWALTPLLMLGGAFLCFEGAEKVLEMIQGGHDEAEEAAETLSSKELEDAKVSGAVRTDFILSGEIVAISLASVADRPLWEQALALAAVAIVITAGVYGAVGFIVKMDDIGLHMAKGSTGFGRAFGRGLVKAMPVVMHVLSYVGTAAMLWVGGGILLHGIESFGWDMIPHAVHGAAGAVGHAAGPFAGFVEWLVTAAASGVLGLIVGAVIVAALHLLPGRTH